MDRFTPDSRETERLLSQVKAGDRQAVDSLFGQHRRYLRQFVELRLDPKLRARVDPSDVVQEAQLEAARRLSDYVRNPPLPFRLWLRQLAYDQVLMARRRHITAARRTVDREFALPEKSSMALARQLIARGASPSASVERRDLAGQVQQAMTQLSELDHEVILLRTFEGLAFEEVACLLSIDPAAARKRHGRALLRLHKFLSVESDD